MASLLLQRGALWNQADSSLNTPLHYAAGFGWIDCVNLLLATAKGRDAENVGKEGFTGKEESLAMLNAENAWKVTPINLAMMKNRRSCVKLLLE